jgi:hypothetical protein
MRGLDTDPNLKDRIQESRDDGIGHSNQELRLLDTEKIGWYSGQALRHAGIGCRKE